MQKNPTFAINKVVVVMTSRTLTFGSRLVIIQHHVGHVLPHSQYKEGIVQTTQLDKNKGKGWT